MDGNSSNMESQDYALYEADSSTQQPRIWRRYPLLFGVFMFACGTFGSIGVLSATGGVTNAANSKAADDTGLKVAAVCSDDEVCLKQNPGWERWSCARSVSYCSNSYPHKGYTDITQHCCPKTCNNCQGSGEGGDVHPGDVHPENPVGRCKSSCNTCISLMEQYPDDVSLTYNPACASGDGTSLGCAAHGADCCQFCGSGVFSSNECKTFDDATCTGFNKLKFIVKKGAFRYTTVKEGESLVVLGLQPNTMTQEVALTLERRCIRGSRDPMCEDKPVNSPNWVASQYEEFFGEITLEARNNYLYSLAKRKADGTITDIEDMGRFWMNDACVAKTGTSFASRSHYRFVDLKWGDHTAVLDFNLAYSYDDTWCNGCKEEPKSFNGCYYSKWD